MLNSKLEHAQMEINSILLSTSPLVQKQEIIKLKIIDLLTIRTTYFEQFQQGITPEKIRDTYKDQSDWYKKQQDVYENHHQGGGNPAWIQLDCYKGLKPSTGINIKLYRSIPIEEYVFISHLGKLKGHLDLLSDKTGDCISFKFPRGFVAFLKHRDSLVVHFQKKENIDSINDILEAWMKENNITREKREDSRSEIAADHSGMSFSELIAINIAHQIIKYPHQLDILLHGAIEQSQKSNLVLR
ncbi:hypothetical protein K2X92_03590 [Candidatus Gracilibacteria bacterium]|nr:hypothetical protein [Candidatus Gracilibacteria bacterium]